jgi:hypothetical protein
MAANPNIAPRVNPVNPVFEEKTMPVCDPQPLGLKERVRDLLVEIFERHEEFLGWTPD